MRERLVLERPCLPRTSMYSINRMTDGCGKTKCCERRTRSPSSSTTSAEPFHTSRTARGMLTMPSASYDAFNNKTFRVSVIGTPGPRIEDRGSRIENRGLRIDESQNCDIFDPLSSILYPLSSKPAARFELTPTAYETVALPIELRRHCNARCQFAPQFKGHSAPLSRQAGSKRYGSSRGR